MRARARHVWSMCGLRSPLTGRQQHAGQPGREGFVFLCLPALSVPHACLPLPAGLQGRTRDAAVQAAALMEAKLANALRPALAMVAVIRARPDWPLINTTFTAWSRELLTGQGVGAQDHARRYIPTLF